MRRLSTRVYSVNGLLALWHIDGNHKLITIQMVIQPCAWTALAGCWNAGVTL